MTLVCVRKNIRHKSRKKMSAACSFWAGSVVQLLPIWQQLHLHHQHPTCFCSCPSFSSEWSPAKPCFPAQNGTSFWILLYSPWKYVACSWLRCTFFQNDSNWLSKLVGCVFVLLMLDSWNLEDSLNQRWRTWALRSKCSPPETLGLPPGKSLSSWTIVKYSKKHVVSDLSDCLFSLLTIGYNW